MPPPPKLATADGAKGDILETIESVVISNPLEELERQKQKDEAAKAKKAREVSERASERFLPWYPLRQWVAYSDREGCLQAEKAKKVQEKRKAEQEAKKREEAEAAAERKRATQQAAQVGSEPCYDDEILKAYARGAAAGKHARTPSPSILAVYP